ncbi:diphthine--ammonia ligase [Cyberlindnera jadinii NRRL Y-1542]|uniref:Diphthine--ammonia ligase n=1 Tax=Cyberlindnera jadinii (strain ATCC 18201 / CBS 1600 / BCRC 20928 / JCM 3617 / NBRC 0987 / NRRL Y-1542) TaxID=983966 RepID=A0A1E4RXM6_CYBJN|nr:endoribonuclease [Cyberlindnera jadinii NRRL Y-1542]ODV71951.1 endoribonuclease [Cyberlindnera jadinii NRRL Y-1542]
MAFILLKTRGKDSCFNILHCLANGHEIVALANLRPADHDIQELDSFMFQTVGHDAIDLYGECTGLPLYRGDIHGTSKNQKLDYEKTEDDEIEDLYRLLSRIKQDLEIEAVSVGAILSSYQRTRVENVCARLGLTSLAYLWQRDQQDLMSEMVESSMDAILIKVAAVGLNETHLGKSLKEMFATLLRLNQRFDVHICGEGGEFETLVLDAPFFIKKLEIVSSEISKEDGGVAYFHPKVKCVEKKPEDGAEFYNIKEKELDWSRFIPGERKEPQLVIKKSGNKLYVSNISSDAKSVEEQVREVFDKLESVLTTNGVTTTNIQHSTLLVADMAQFATINSLYVKSFTEPLPPSRVCIQTRLPKGKHLQLSVVVMVPVNKKTGLHVQGRSYWAPANIGPYSQTVIDENMIATLSGQIPLIPSSMELSTYASSFNSVLSLQHLDNVKSVVGCTNQLSVVAFIKDKCLVPVVSQTWREYSLLDSEANPPDVLLIVQVEELPRGADVEWGGLSYKKITSILSMQGPSYSNGSSDVVSTLALALDEFLNLTLSKDAHHTIYTTPDKTQYHATDSFMDLIPVSSVWNYKGEQVEFGVVVRTTPSPSSV